MLSTFSHIQMDFSIKFNAKAIENSVRNYLDNLDLKGYLKTEWAGKDLVGYIEGPPTMNGEPHVGHLRGRIIKDSSVQVQHFTKKESYLSRLGGHTRLAGGITGRKGAWADGKKGRKCQQGRSGKNC